MASPIDASVIPSSEPSALTKLPRSLVGGSTGGVEDGAAVAVANGGSGGREDPEVSAASVTVLWSQAASRATTTARPGKMRFMGAASSRGGVAPFRSAIAESTLTRPGCGIGMTVG